MKRKIPQNNLWFRYENVNPKDKTTGDCVIRAIAKALNKSWEDVYTELCELGLKLKEMPNSRRVYEKYLEQAGFIRCNQPRRENNKRYTVREFIDELSYLGRTYIIHPGLHHLSCIIDGQVVDTWDCSQECLGIYWVKK